MKRMIVAGLFFCALLMGCGNSNEPDDTPNDEEQGAEENMGQAAEDEFTNQFLVSTEEEEEGFYRMRGELGGFEMLIPRDAKISDLIHEIENDNVETLEYSFKEQDKTHSLYVLHQEKFAIDRKESYLNVLKKDVGLDEDEDLDYKEMNNTEIYSGELKSEDDYGLYQIHFGYVISDETKQALSYEYTVTCGQKDCDDLIIDDDNERIKKILRSIKLVEI